LGKKQDFTENKKSPLKKKKRAAPTTLGSFKNWARNAVRKGKFLTPHEKGVLGKGGKGNLDSSHPKKGRGVCRRDRRPAPTEGKEKTKTRLGGALGEGGGEKPQSATKAKAREKSHSQNHRIRKKKDVGKIKDHGTMDGEKRATEIQPKKTDPFEPHLWTKNPGNWGWGGKAITQTGKGSPQGRRNMRRVGSGGRDGGRTDAPAPGFQRNQSPFRGKDVVKERGTSKKTHTVEGGGEEMG